MTRLRVVFVTFAATLIAGVAPAWGATATTGSATAIGYTTATLGATVNLQGATLVSCSFGYGLTVVPTSTAPCSPTPSGSSDVAVSAAATGLTAATTYHFQVTLLST